MFRCLYNPCATEALRSTTDIAESGLHSSETFANTSYVMRRLLPFQDTVDKLRASKHTGTYGTFRIYAGVSSTGAEGLQEIFKGVTGKLQLRAGKVLLVSVWAIADQCNSNVGSKDRHTAVRHPGRPPHSYQGHVHV